MGLLYWFLFFGECLRFCDFIREFILCWVWSFFVDDDFVIDIIGDLFVGLY